MVLNQYYNFTDSWKLHLDFECMKYIIFLHTFLQFLIYSLTLIAATMQFQ